MRIAAVTHSVSRLGGGIPVAMQRLYGQIERTAGVSVTVFGLADQHTRDDLALWEPVRVEAHRVRGPAVLGCSPGLSRALQSSSSDLLHTHGCWKYASQHVHHWRRTTARPYVVSPHGMLDSWALQNSRWKKRIAWRWFERAHLRDAACLHALTGAEVQSIRKLGLNQPVCVIPNGIDLPDLSPPVAANGERPPTVLFLGRIHPKKGLAELIAAWDIFHRRNGDWRLQIAGWDDGGHEAELREEVRRAGLGGVVEFLGPQFAERKQRAYQRATAFVLPSYSEGLPMTVLEAWSWGVPVIMTPACNLPEGFQADAAVAIQPDPDSIAEGLARFAELSNDARSTMGENGRNLVARGFSWPAIAAEFVAVYRWVAGEGAQPASVVAA